MRHALESGDGLLSITGRPGTGKSTLIDWFLGEFENGEVLCATLSSTAVDGDDLLRMVAYAFGLDARGLEKSSLVHNLRQHLQAHRRSLLVIDEAQNLSCGALEEVLALINLQAGSQPLLQIFLVGQDRLHEQLHDPELEQLRQRLTASCTLEPLTLRETRDYILHRLKCVGWRDNPEISPVVFVLVHRYAQGLPRHINQVCTHLLLRGAIEKRQLLDFDDVVSVVQSIALEKLMPLTSTAGMDSSVGFPPVADLVRSVGRPVGQRLALSEDEQAFLAESQELRSVKQEASVHRFRPVDNAVELPQGIPESTLRFDSGYRFFAYAAILAVAVVGGYQLGSIDGKTTTEQGVFPVTPVMASIEEPVSSLPAVDAVVASQPPAAAVDYQLLARFDYSKELDLALGLTTAAPLIILDTPGQIRLQEFVDIPVQKEALSTVSKPSSSEIADTQEATALENEIRQLLLHGEEAVVNNRLKRPKDKNAWYYYSQVLTLVPGHQDAERGLRQVVERYGNLIVHEIDTQHYSLAQLYINRAMSIAPKDKQIMALQSRLTADQQALLTRLENDQLLASSSSAVNSTQGTREARSGGLLDGLKTLFTGGRANK